MDLERLCWRLGTDDLLGLRKNLEASLEEALTREVIRRQPCWTESLAVGSAGFVERIQTMILSVGRLELRRQERLRQFRRFMEQYVSQLLEEIACAAKNVDWPYRDNGHDLEAWVPDHEEEQTAPRVPLEKWTGIRKNQLPSVERLNDGQMHRLLEALKKLLDACNWVFVLQTEVPDRVQYATLREHFDQEAKIKHCHLGFFQLCAPGTTHGTCTLGEHCQCRFYAELFGEFVDEKLSPDEERARKLEWEISHLKEKYGVEWEKYYPYHLDRAYDDKDGNPYDYGFGEEDQEDDDDWWRHS